MDGGGVVGVGVGLGVGRAGWVGWMGDGGVGVGGSVINFNPSMDK